MTQEEKERDASGYILYLDNLEQKHKLREIATQEKKQVREVIVAALMEKYPQLK